MKKILITGANRGIGLELVRQLVERGSEVYATCRRSSDELSAATPHVIEGIDVGQQGCIEKLDSSLSIDQLDCVINVAGVLESNSWDGLDFTSIEKQFQVNALGPLRVVKAVVNRISKGGKIAMITSRMGSIADNTSGGSYGYRMSKAALNMASVSLAQDLQSKGIAVGIIHPGYVRTEMTHNSGNIDTNESARGILARIDELNLNNSGTFWHQNGEVLPW